MFNIRKFNKYLKNKIKIGLGYKDKATKRITILLYCDYKLKLIFVL